jgi:signal transduction histidine kinase/DNA-binding response OmpR family regulator
MPTRRSSASEGRPRRVSLTRSYQAALIVISALIIGGALVVDGALHNLRDDGPLVNITGRQRMLSQKLAKAALIVATSPDPTRRAAARAEIADAADQLATNRTYLLSGGSSADGLATSGQGGAMRGAARQIVVANAEAFATLHASATTLADSMSPPDSVQRAMARILAAEPSFLIRVDEAVAALGAQSAARVGRARQVMWSIAVAVLLGLVATGVLVLRPAARRARSAFLQLARANEDLDIALSTAEELTKAKSEFLATMSHELRTPLNAVIGLSGLLGDSKLDERQRVFVSTINRSGEALLGLINNILDLSKIDAGKLELELVEFDVRELVETTAETLALRAEGRNVELATFVAPNVPARVRGDPERVRQVLINLVGNALKFTEEGAVNVRVTVGWKEDLRFEVVDTGIGIPADRLDRLFKAFSQVDASTTRRFGGTGLGLDISKKLVDLMNGVIGVQSEVGVGSTFHFELPLTAVGSRTSDDAAALAGKRVLIVDDAAANRRTLDEIARAWQMEPAEADGAESALAALTAAQAAGSPFDLALLDWQMPDVDGYGLARRIRETPAIARTPLVMISSFTHMVDRAELQAAGFAARLSKPVRQRPLLDAIDTALTPANAVLATIAAAVQPTQARYPGKRVLVADDNPVNVLVLKAMLDPYGVRVDVAADGIEVTDAIMHARYDLILMDVYMPRLDGRGATHAVRAREAEAGIPRAPIVACTASVTEDDRQACLDAGMDDYVSKPIARDVLDRTLARWVGTAGPVTL